MSKWRGKTADQVSWGSLRYWRPGDGACWRTSVFIPEFQVIALRGLDNAMAQVASQQNWYSYHITDRWIDTAFDPPRYACVVDVHEFWALGSRLHGEDRTWGGE